MLTRVWKRAILLPNRNLLTMKGNTKERVGWQLLRNCCEVRLAPNHALHISRLAYNWLTGLNGMTIWSQTCFKSIDAFLFGSTARYRKYTWAVDWLISETVKLNPHPKIFQLYGSVMTVKLLSQRNNITDFRGRLRRFGSTLSYC